MFENNEKYQKVLNSLFVSNKDKHSIAARLVKLKEKLNIEDNNFTKKKLQKNSIEFLKKKYTLLLVDKNNQAILINLLLKRLEKIPNSTTEWFLHEFENKIDENSLKEHLKKFVLNEYDTLSVLSDEVSAIIFFNKFELQSEKAKKFVNDAITNRWTGSSTCAVM